MKCPSCGHIQPDGSIECERCQIVFAKWKPRETRSQSFPVQPVPTMAPPSYSIPPKGVDLSLIIQLGAAVVLGLALWWLLVPGANPVPEGAYRNEKHRFAVSAPPEWLMLTKENYDALMTEHGDRFPAAFRDLIKQSKNLVVGFFKLEGGKAFPPAFNIVVVGSSLPVNDSMKEEASIQLSRTYSSLVKDYREEGAEIISVDGLKSIDVIWRGSLKAKTAEAQYYESENEWGGVSREKIADVEYTTYKLQYRQVMVPGKKRAYIITFTALERRFDDFRGTFQEILDSFRVLQRPARFGPVLNGALVGGVIGGLIAILGMLIKRIAGG